MPRVFEYCEKLSQGKGKYDLCGESCLKFFSNNTMSGA